MSPRARPWLRAFFVAAGLVGLAAAWVALRDVPTLTPDGVSPPDASRTSAATGPRAAPVVEGHRLRGVFHVHSDSSHDGRVPAAGLMAAADRLELDFVIFTEHDAQPVHASSPDGALAVPGTELSTRYGHLIYLGHPRIPPDGERGRIGLPDSLAARGALTILAHPASPRRPWLGRRLGVGGLEIASTSSDARVKGDPIVRLLVPLFALPLNPRLALSQLYRRNREALEIWDRLENPSTKGFCGTDTHGWIEAELNFRTWQIVLDPWPAASRGVTDASAPVDADALVDRLATGRFFCLAGLLVPAGGPPPHFAFAAVTAGASIPQGRSVPRDSALALEVEAPALEDGGRATTVLLRDGREVDRTTARTLRHTEPAPGTYRVEVRVEIPDVFFGGREVPVLYSNRIRVTE